MVFAACGDMVMIAHYYYAWMALKLTSCKFSISGPIIEVVIRSEIGSSD
jgi:hypothetical protein